MQADIIQAKGMFQLRPTSIYFDIYYRWEEGRWKLFGIDLQPLEMVSAMPGPTAQVQQAPQQRDNRRGR